MENKGYELQEVYEQMKELLFEAKQIVRGTKEEDRAESYWAAQIAMALDDDHGYLGSATCSMLSTIESLLYPETDNDNEEEEDDE